MKRSFLIILIALLLVLSGCIRSYEFMNNENEVTSIEIVQIGAFICETRVSSDGISSNYLIDIEETVIAVVEDKEAFLKDFKSLSIGHQINPPFTFQENTIAIKITYSNGEYELIERQGHAVYHMPTNDNLEWIDIYGFNDFDEQEFTNLIEKYS